MQSDQKLAPEEVMLKKSPDMSESLHTIRIALSEALDAFLEYRKSHKLKNTPESDVKAMRNERLADQMRTAFDLASGL